MQLNEIHTEHEHATTSLKVVLLVFAIVLVGALSYLVWASNTAPDTTDNSATTVKPTTISTTDWKTYTGTADNYTFKYPKGWILDSSGAQWSVTLTSPETVKSNKDCAEPCEGAGPDITFDSFASPKDLANTADPASVNIKTVQDLIDIDSQIQVDGSGISVVGGVSSRKVTIDGMDRHFAYLVPKGTSFFQILFRNRSSEGDLSATDKAIVDSFKFTN